MRVHYSNVAYAHCYHPLGAPKMPTFCSLHLLNDANSDESKIAMAGISALQTAAIGMRVGLVHLLTC